MSLELAEEYNASLAGDVSPEQAVNTLQSHLRQNVEEGQQVNQARPDLRGPPRGLS